MTRKLALAVLLLVVLSGCSRGPTLDQAGRQALVTEAAALLAAHPDDGASVSILKNKWPATIRSIGPSDVRADAIGLYVSMGSFLVRETGYFVPRNEAAFSPMVGGEPSYQALGDGAYWFEIKG